MVSISLDQALGGSFDLNLVDQDRLELDRIILKALGFKNIDRFLKSYYQSVVSIVNERMHKAKSVNSTTKKSKQSLPKVADEILSKLDIKEFPHDYILCNLSDTISISKGSVVLKGVDLNGIYVSIDGKKMYFEDRNTAKYVYYGAKRGMESVPIPEDIKSILDDFEKDLKNWKESIKKEIDSITSDKKYREQLFGLCVRKLNYSILEEETIK